MRWHCGAAHRWKGAAGGNLSRVDLRRQMKCDVSDLNSERNSAPYYCYYYRKSLLALRRPPPISPSIPYPYNPPPDLSNDNRCRRNPSDRMNMQATQPPPPTRTHEP